MSTRQPSSFPLVAVLLLVAALALAGCGGGGEGDEGGGSSSSATFAEIPEIVEEVKPSVVAVLARTPGGQGEGSGVIWDSGGLIVTNDHVVRDGRRSESRSAAGSAPRRRSGRPIASPISPCWRWIVTGCPPPSLHVRDLGWESW